MGGEVVHYNNEFYIEDSFCMAVLQEAKKLLGEDQKYLKLARMVKLVTFVADEVNFDLTRGWYKYGDYSPNAYSIAKDFSDEDLPSLDIPSELGQRSLKEFRDKISSIDGAIEKLRPYFIKDQTTFYNWVYRQKAPKEYRHLYLVHQDFSRYFLDFLKFLRLPTAFKDTLDKNFKCINKIVTTYHNSIEHIEDEEVLSIFYDYMDLFEMVMLKTKNSDYHIGKEGMTFLENLNELYCGTDNDLWTLLVPYEETLVGMGADDEKEWYRRKVHLTKPFVKENLELSGDQAEESGLLPDAEEIEAEIKRCDSESGKERKSLREINSSV